MYFKNSCPWVRSYVFIGVCMGCLNSHLSDIVWILRPFLSYSVIVWIQGLGCQSLSVVTVLRKPLFSNFLPGAVCFFSVFFFKKKWIVKFFSFILFVNFLIKGVRLRTSFLRVMIGWSFLAFTHFKAVNSWSSALKPVTNAVTRRRRKGFL